MPDKETAYLIGSSYTEFFPSSERRSLLRTSRLAHEVEADGAQLYIHPTRLAECKDDPIQVRDSLLQFGLTKNITHLQGTLTPESFGLHGEAMVRASVQMVQPIDNLGVICVLHHDPLSLASPESIADSTEGVLSRVSSNVPVTIGLENFYDGVTNENLGDQVNKYMELYGYLRQRGLPVISVLDARRLYERGVDGEFLRDPSNVYLKQLCSLSENQLAILHALDVRDDSDYFKGRNNNVKIGTGKLEGMYRSLAAIGKEYNVHWRLLVDESSEPVVTGRQDIDDTLALFK